MASCYAVIFDDNAVFVGNITECIKISNKILKDGYEIAITYVVLIVENDNKNIKLGDKEEYLYKKIDKSKYFIFNF